MARMTREQLKKINDNMSNGFKLDLQYYLIHNEKRAHKYIELDNGDKLECAIDYFDYKSWKNNFQTDLRIEISTRIWKPTTSGCWSCATGSRRVEHSKGYTKKMFNKIQEITKEITDDMIYNIDCKNADDVIVLGY